MGLEFVNVRLACVGRTDKPAVPELPRGGDDPSHAGKGRRRIYLREAGCLDVPVFDGSALRHGNRLSGPAIVEQAHTTVLVLPEFDLVCDRHGSFVMFQRDHADQLRVESAVVEAA